MKIGFTGTSNVLAVTDVQSEKMATAMVVLSEHYGIEEVHHGDCIGADAVFHYRAWEQGLRTVIHPPIDDKKRAWCQIDPINGGEILEPKEYLVRNNDIVLATDMLIAMPESREQKRSGTWSTVRRARENHRPILLFYPDGVVAEENWDRMPGITSSEK